ncbi:macrolide ABC transporter permease [Sporomusaceae bacterium FL31]|nr:macrolide ABC transporter permease [Sporomusaceae bacterium FL31]GCE35178.1 macrolide ABC transporter permease [Sporomusaceae bacterium]
MFWQILKGSLVRQRQKMFMVAITIALGVSLTTAMLNVMLDVGDKVNRELKAYGANITVTPRSASVLHDFYGVDAGGAGQYLQEAELGKLKTIFWANNIVDFAPILETKVLIGQTAAEITLVGTWFNHRLDLPTGESVETGIKQLKSWWSVDGNWVQDNSQSAMIGSIAARKLGVHTGDEIDIAVPGSDRKAKVKVEGIFNSGGPEDEEVFVPLSVAQNLKNLTGKVGKIEVSAITTPENELARKAAHDPKSLSLKEWETWYCTAYVGAIAYQIEEAITGAHAKPVRQVAESEGAILQKTQLLMLLITILSLIGSTLGISNLLTASVMERNREIGLLKALGATDAEVLMLTLSQILFTGIAGGFAGYFLGLGFAQIIGQTVFSAAVAAKPMVIPLVMALVVLVTLTGSFPAIRMLVSLRPAEVLHGR